MTNTEKTKTIKNQHIMNDYEQAKSIAADLGLSKQKTITPLNTPNFRRYLSLVAMKAGRKYVTKIMGKDVLVIRVT